MKKTLQWISQIENRIVRILIFSIFFMLLPAWLEWAIPKFLPASHYVEYEGTTVLEAYEGAPYFRVFSYAEIKRPVKLYWNDVLYCESTKGFEFVTSNSNEYQYMSKTSLPRIFLNPETGLVEEIGWRFFLEDEERDSVKKGNRCYIESTVTAFARGDYKAPFKVTSNVFIIQ